MIVGAVAPAKINLGLEILGRRPDGYHEIRTILVAISLSDRLSFRDAERLSVESDADVGPDDENLVTVAARAIAARTKPLTPSIRIQKRIPAAAGLGGASSDAASALLALDRLYALDLSSGDLEDLASGIGSDVPFFIAGGVSRASGRGERLERAEKAIDCIVIVVAPHVQIPSKTAQLYGSLIPNDFSDGRRIDSAFGSIREGRIDEAISLDNAFERALYERISWLRDIPDGMRALGARMVGLSGAGPAHYALELDGERAARLGQSFGERFGSSASVFVCRPIPRGGSIASAPTETDLHDWFEHVDSTSANPLSAGFREFDHNMIRSAARADS